MYKAKHERKENQRKNYPTPVFSNMEKIRCQELRKMGVYPLLKAIDVLILSSVLH